MKTKILILIEDDNHTAFSLATNLHKLAKSSGLQLRVFTDADEGLKFIRNTEHFLIVGAIVDLWMIDKSTGAENDLKGSVVIELLKQLHPSVHILILSSHITAKDKEEFEKDKTVFALRKPTTVNEIWESLRLESNL